MIFFMPKVGYGTNGIVSAGKIISDPELDDSWREDGKKVFYCDYESKIMICPDVFPILESKELAEKIPDFDWFGGHAGVVLSPQQSAILNELWSGYLQKIVPEFRTRLSGPIKRSGYNDHFYYWPEEFSDGID